MGNTDESSPSSCEGRMPKLKSVWKVGIHWKQRKGHGICSEAPSGVEQGLVKSSYNQRELIILSNNVGHNEPRTQASNHSSCPGAKLKSLIFNILRQGLPLQPWLVFSF